jgi:hypothetical protein
MRRGKSKERVVRKKQCYHTSPPEEWIKALFPDKPDKQKPKDHIVSIANWCMYSNTKAMMMNAGQKEASTQSLLLSLSKKFFFALYLLNGLTPSPQLKMKFKAQHEDLINGSVVCYLGKNAKKCHEKALFSC